MRRIAVYGGGGFAREVAWLVESCGRVGNEKFEVVCFIDDDQNLHGTKLNGVSVYSLSDAAKLYPDAEVISGIGSPTAREVVMTNAQLAGFRCATIIHPSVEYSTTWNSIGEGTVICAGSILTVNIGLGKHVQINLDCTIGHDAILGDYTTLAPGVHVSGWVHMGKRVYVGTGANIINGTQDQPIIIADDVTIGAGACVTKSVEESGITVVGVPARPLRSI